MVRNKMNERRTQMLEKGGKIFIVLLFLSSLLYSVEVCKFSYKGQPEDYYNDTIVVPDDMVAMSEYLYVGTPKDTVYDTIHQPSIMFVIDHSGSMYGYSGLDIWGNRFKVTHDLIDTILTHSPYAEVGVAIFNRYLYYDNRDDPIFETIPQDTSVAAYLPLLQLNKDYNGKKGYEIIKQYLETDTLRDTTGMSIINGDTTWIIQKAIGLKYRSRWYKDGSTNINVGFHAVRKAMQSAQYLKENHFTIFFSDGKATVGSPSPGAYVQDASNGIPTTFTVYFIAQGGAAPQELIDMTSNIQNSAYSPTNPKSNLWEFQNTGYDQLMKFLMENVIKEILKKSVFNPTQIIVNGDTVTNWDTTGFTFDDLFPLTGWVTPFDFDIDYHVIKDTLNEVTGQLDTIEFDTTIYIEFDVEIDPNEPPLDTTKFDVRCWNRDLGFYDNGTLVSAIKETMNPIELRFTFNSGDANYSYTKASVDITTVTGNGQDRETFTLTKNGNIFSVNIPNIVIDAGASPTVGDGNLQHYEEDTVVVTFRNDEKPKLPLDTLVIRVPTTFAGTVEIDIADYYDTNADGYVDSISVKASTDIVGGLTTTHVQELIDNTMTLPSFRNFSVTGSGLITDGFYLLTTEDNNHNPVTYVTTNDKIDIKEYSFTTGGKILAKTVSIRDKVAPIIHWEPKAALLRDYKVTNKRDTLGVKFSEPVHNTSASEPFYFLDVGTGNNYTVTLSAVGRPKLDSMIFEVVSVNGTMEDGDSLWIHETDRLCDTVGNYQNNTKNIKRRLYIDNVYGSLTVERAYYYDNNGDGYIDSIPVVASTTMDGGLTAAHVKELLENALSLPAFRAFTVNGSGMLSDGFYIKVTEDKSHNPFTYITNDDKVVTINFTLSNGGNVLAKTSIIYDKVAPLVHWDARSALAVVHQDETVADTLFVTFSEPVKKVNATVPFNFLSISNNATYTADLKTLEQPSSEKMIFEVQSLSGIDKMRDGDSIWIHEGDRIGDECKDESGNTVTNYQNNRKNTKRRLYIERRLLPFELIPVSVSPIDVNTMQSSDKFIIPDRYIEIFEKQRIFNDLKLRKNSDGKYVGMIINIVPDNLENVFEGFKLKGNLTILDPVGNRIVEKKRMGWDEDNKRLIFAWNVKNTNGRFVGSSMYLCLIEIEEISDGPDNTGLKESKKLMIGVR